MLKVERLPNTRDWSVGIQLKEGLFGVLGSSLADTMRILSWRIMGRTVYQYFGTDFQKAGDCMFLEGKAEEDAELRSLFMSSMVNMYHRLCDKFANIINLTPGQRVARFILRNAARDSSWEIHISTSELAQAVTTTRQTVSHVLADLRRDGIVETSYSRIKVLKPEGLKKYMGSVS